MGEFVMRHWIELTIGVGLTLLSSLVMEGARGYFALGGEWLLAPFFVFVGVLVRDFIQFDLPWVMDIIMAEDDEEWEEEE